MPSCECCYADRQMQQAMRGVCVELSDVISDHEKRGCLCTKDTPEGAKARAGQFWNEDRQTDMRTEHAQAQEIRAGGKK